MADISILDPAVHAAPKAYTIKGAQEIILKGVTASFDGTSAAGSWVPAVQVVDPSGFVVGTYVLQQTLSAGATADVSWFPGVSQPTTTPAPSPNPLGTLFAWFDFSDSTTITLDGFGNISAIKDKTGNGHDLSQGTAGSRPGQTTINALSAGLFVNARQTTLFSATFSTALAQPGTVAGVWSCSGTADATHFPGVWDSVVHTQRWALFQNGNFNQIAAAAGSGGNANIALTAPYTQQQSTVFYQGAGSAIRLNGVGAGGAMATNALGSILLGNQPQVVGQNDYLSGAICEVLYYAQALTNSQRDAVESYLKSKWGTP